LKSLPIPVPPIELQEKFAIIGGAVAERRAATRSQLGELDELFQSLQRRAFAGLL